MEKIKQAHKELTKEQGNRLGHALLNMAELFYKDPQNKADFEKWQAEKRERLA